MAKIYLSSKEKDIIGRSCCNCGDIKDLQYHHIVPLAAGGNNCLSNICCLCYTCHAKLHFGSNKALSHSHLTKSGIEKAREEGKQIGRKAGQKVATKKSIEMKNKIKNLSIDFEGDIKDSDLLPYLGISRNTFYKYKKELKQAVNS